MTRSSVPPSCDKVQEWLIEVTGAPILVDGSACKDLGRYLVSVVYPCDCVAKSGGSISLPSNAREYHTVYRQPKKRSKFNM